MIRKILIGLLGLLFLLLEPLSAAHSAAPPMEKKSLFELIESLTQVPWYDLAAVNQYEQNVRDAADKKAGEQLAIEIPAELWAGALNPETQDTTPFTIQLFHGIGQDGDGNGRAERHNRLDLLYALGNYLTQKGTSQDAIRERLWLYYQHPTAIDIISHMAKVFAKYEKVDLSTKHFPLPKRAHYTYRSTWGAKRGWGGARMHEGTDLFADYGTPVMSTCYGYVELIGWNRYGGWRIGIRDMNNNYHYFAHLNGFRKGLKKGDVVRPGELIGKVGSSGYGPPGTSGKFPPHLHYGIYHFNGKKSYAIDPYPVLKRWERGK
jgi:peptidoglycan LD-endopeptidase LytH